MEWISNFFLCRFILHVQISVSVLNIYIVYVRKTTTQSVKRNVAINNNKTEKKLSLIVKPRREHKIIMQFNIYDRRRLRKPVIKCVFKNGNALT